MDAETNEQPYRHVVVAGGLCADVADAVLGRLEQAVWTQYWGDAFRIERATIDDAVDKNLFSDLIEAVGHELSGSNLRRGISANVTFHRYRPGAGIGPHSDSGCDETRIILNLNRGWNAQQGGVWILSSEQTLSRPRRCLPPFHNTGFGFQIKENSFHAMTNVSGTDLYAVIIAFKNNTK